MAVKTYAGNKRGGDTTISLKLDDGFTMHLGDNHDMSANDIGQLSPLYILLDGVVVVDLTQFPWYNNTSPDIADGPITPPFFGYARLDNTGAVLDGSGNPVGGSTPDASSIVKGKTFLNQPGWAAGLSASSTDAGKFIDAYSGTPRTQPLLNVTHPPFNAKGDKELITDAAITNGASAMSSVSRPFTSADVGKFFILVGAGGTITWRGNWATATSYAVGDVVRASTADGGVLVWCNIAHTSTGVAIQRNFFFAIDAPDDTSGGTVPPSSSRSRPPLMGKILSVNTGTGVATVSTSGGGALTAGATVTGARLTIMSDDTAAFQAADDYAESIGGATVLVPRPPGGLGYGLWKLFVTSNVKFQIDPGVIFDVVPGKGAGHCFGLRGKTSSTYSTNCELSTTNAMFDFTDRYPGQSSNGILIGQAFNYVCHGFDQYKNPDGNTVQLARSLTPDFLNPIIGDVDRIRSIMSPYGFGAVQADDANGLTIKNLWSDGGRALNLEADDQSPNGSRIVTNVNGSNFTCDPTGRNRYFANGAVGIVSHSNTITDVKISSIKGVAWADGIHFGQSSFSTSVIDRISISGVDVRGGGLLVSMNDGMVFTRCVIEEAVGDGCAYVDISSGSISPACLYAPGMTLRNVKLYNPGGVGFKSIGPVAGPSVGSGTVRFEDCHVSGATGEAVQHLYFKRAEFHRCNFTDQRITDFTPAPVADHQTSIEVATTFTSTGTNVITVASGTSIAIGQLALGAPIPAGTTVTNVAGTSITLSSTVSASGPGTAVTFMAVGIVRSGGASMTRDLGVFPRGMKLVAAGSTTTISGRMTKVSQQVTSGNIYRGVITALTDGASIKATDGTSLLRLAVQIAWYQAADLQSVPTLVTTSSGSNVTFTASGTAIEAQVTATAPAFTGGNTIMFGSMTCLISAAATNVPAQAFYFNFTAFGEVAATGGTQTYGINAAQGTEVVLQHCALHGNTTGRITGAGAVREVVTRDPSPHRLVTRMTDITTFSTTATPLKRVLMAAEDGTPVFVVGYPATAFT